MLHLLDSFFKNHRPIESYKSTWNV